VKNSDKSIINQKEYDNYRVQKNSMPRLHEVIGGTKQRFIVKTLYVGDASLQLRTVKLGPTKV